MSRSDSVGLFWQEEERKGPEKIAAVMPDIPETGWVSPTSFPDLSAAPVISLDTETYDPELLAKGPGWARGVGHIIGVSLAVPGGHKWYFPVRHEIEPEMNMDPEKVFAWLRKELSRPNQIKVGANLIYDIGWLQTEEVYVKGPLYDTQHAEALLHESGVVNLDFLGEKYLDQGKQTNLLYQWCSDYYYGPANGKQRKNLYRAPPRLVGPYAEDDADLPLRILEKQWPLLEKEQLLEVFEMENKLTPLLVAMRYEGVSVDINAAEKASERLNLEIAELQGRLNYLAGFDVNINAAAHLQKLFDQLGLKYPLTAKGNPSFIKSFLAGIKHPVGELIRGIRELEKLTGTFIEGYILNSHIDGKVYGNFHCLRSDEGGTRSGRFSSSLPNLQNIPSRHPEFGPLIRGMFIPDEGHAAWRKYDYSQIEYRCLINDAVGPGSEEARQHFNAHPETDYHDLTQTLVEKQTGIYIERKPLKNINFGLIYGMSFGTLCETLGISQKEGKPLFKAYHSGAPYAQSSMDYYSKLAQTQGYVSTIKGRRSRFELWEPRRFTRGAVALPYQKALMQYGDVVRAGTFKAINRRLQGSAADLMKEAMVQCYEQGVFAETGVPRLTVHDELDFSDPGGKDEAFKEMKHIMETAIPMQIPVKADGEIGTDWGHVKDID